MDNVVEVLSFEERNTAQKSRQENVHARARKRTKRPFAFSNEDAVIELTDTDDEGGASPKKRPKIVGKGEPEAGPSRLLESRPRPATRPKSPRSTTNKRTHSLRAENSDGLSKAASLIILNNVVLPAVPDISQYKANLAIDTPTNVAQVNPEQPDQRPPSVPPSDATNSIDIYIAQVLEVIPDVKTDHILMLIQQYLPAFGDNVVQNVLHVLFEDPAYPKVEKGKRKRDETKDDDRGEPNNAPLIDYANKHRKSEGGQDYVDLALEQLFVDFPFVPKPHVRTIFYTSNALYAPAHIFLASEIKTGNLSYKRKTVPNRPKGKGKEKHDAHFEAERRWLLSHLQNEVAKNDTTVAAQLRDDEEVLDGIECGCCFADYPFDQMIQCPDTHLFCSSCMTSYASNLLGEHNPNIICMDQSGCKLPFPLSQLRRFLTPKLMELYDRVKQMKEIEAAGLENLESCPFCEYKVVIENPQEKLFRCESGDCGVVSCRGCKKVDHLPRSCKEVDDDRKLDGRHAIEEAMTRALTRNCPKCNKAFIKEMGCNKMVCPSCHTLSCYICRKIITGYDHFNQQPGVPQQSSSSNKCSLWDVVEKRHAEEVTAAAKRAVEEYKRLHPDVDVKDLAIDLPKIPADPNPNPNPNPNPRPLHPNPHPNQYPNFMWAPVVNVPQLAVPNRVPPPNLRHQPPPVAHRPARRGRRVR